MGSQAAGFPHGKAAQFQPRAAGNPEPKREAGRPWPGSGPSPDFPPGWGRHDSLPPPFPSFLVCISPLGHVAAGAAITAPNPALGQRQGQIP